MAGAGLLEIKRRIKSIKNTRKITKAMGLVATSKLRKARQKLTENNQYFSSLDEIARELIGSLNSNNNPLLKPDVNLDVVLTVPSNVFLISDTLPPTKPFIPSNGPFIIPSAGFTKNSLTPVPSDLNKLVGVPSISMLPNIFIICNNAICLYMFIKFHIIALNSPDMLLRSHPFKLSDKFSKFERNDKIVENIGLSSNMFSNSLSLDWFRNENKICILDAWSSWIKIFALAFATSFFGH
jgi:hypothetical protein